MKRFVYAGIIGSSIFCLSTVVACIQPDKKAFLKEGTEAQPVRISRIR